VPLAHDAVHDSLRRAILDGELAAGDALPGERALAERFGVNRHAVREAIKRLQQARLVEVAQGGATRVLDWRATAGLELLPDLALADPRLLRAALEMRLAIGADVARLAAERGDEELVSRLRAILAAPGDPSARYDELWRALVAGSDNVAYQLADNSLLDAMARLPAAQALTEAEFSDHEAQAALVDAVAAGDGERAAALARDLLRRMLVAASSRSSVR
jgi:DNA-binding FadR family transcriptional regulator